MSDLLSLAEHTLENLGSGVLNLLKNELGEHGTVSKMENHIVICISRTDFEQRLGNLLQQIYRSVEQHFPVRTEQLSIMIRDSETKYENTFKIWPSA
ncbi:hypothetical protein SAMN05192574_102132 [Mucilaginibacter gossypiicola]|uniref:Uncharacterized protein n=1 Tax=Mucilaginibacter gossypiicola TaxID=551995 RepID=A0A1H8D0N5_9SPHI|nr:hypothetical protein [Mucilaginibacter gossypiicola]SEN00047.1 hypothetical protein SAMN05192574_102132 [Mucilaginibacter gossypiicola]